MQRLHVLRGVGQLPVQLVLGHVHGERLFPLGTGTKFFFTTSPLTDTLMYTYKCKLSWHT